METKRKMEGMSRAKLYQIAKKHEIPNRSKMTKPELIAALMNVKNSFELKFGVAMVYDNAKGVRVREKATDVRVKALTKWYKEFSEEQAKAHGVKFENIEVVSVKPDDEIIFKLTMSNTRILSTVELIELTDIIRNNNYEPVTIRGKSYKIIPQSVETDNLM